MVHESTPNFTAHQKHLVEDFAAKSESLHRTQAVKVGAVQKLADAWCRRHRGVPASAHDPAVPPVRYLPLWSLCLQARLPEVVGGQDIISGGLVISWDGFLIDHKACMQHPVWLEGKHKKRDRHDLRAEVLKAHQEVRTPGHGIHVMRVHTHVPVCQLRPYRCCLLPTLPSKPAQPDPVS